MEKKREGVQRDVLQKTGFEELNTASSWAEVRGEKRMTETGKDVRQSLKSMRELKALRQCFLNFKLKGKRNLIII